MRLSYDLRKRLGDGLRTRLPFIRSPSTTKGEVGECRYGSICSVGVFIRLRSHNPGNLPTTCQRLEIAIAAQTEQVVDHKA